MVLWSRVGFDLVYGARPLNRAVQQLVDNPLAPAILEGEFNPGDKVFAALDGSALEFAREALIGSGPEPPTTESGH